MELQLFVCLKFFSNSVLDFRTEWNWIGFSDMQSESVLKCGGMRYRFQVASYSN